MAIPIICVGGARPNFMKLAPLVRALGADPDFRVVLVHTGQHYDDRMSGAFFRELNIPDPNHHLEAGSGSHAQQTAEIMRRFEPVVEQENPGAVLVVGDVNSTLAASIVAKKMQVPVVHVEAGLRSGDRSMPEEINRLVTDSITDLFLVTESSGRANLLREGVAESSIRMVGNLMIDSLLANLERARSGSSIRATLGIADAPFGLVTLHRPANVDDPSQLRGILEALDEIAQVYPLYFPVHPRTRQRLEALEAQNAPTGRLRLCEPLGYLDFLNLMSGAAVVLTDSGGIQEETTALGIPCLTLRDNTERPVTIDEGSNILAGTSRESILGAWKELQTNPRQGRVPALWDGQAAQRCRAALREFFSLP
ncbi:MAG: UDP-N-acetylglucosamine 2-epimerase (non-hydrolyzing) [Bryobacteraceae bacterium]|nr:UDP-N-acetylglucosamine 2-epimerase (non-hydrolyzing) [Bryobacteraceae bacterium]